MAWGCVWKLMRWGSTWTCLPVSRIQRRSSDERSAHPTAPGAPARAALRSSQLTLSCRVCLISGTPTRSPSAGGVEARPAPCAGCVRGHSKDVMKRRSRPPTLTSIRRACQWLGRCGMCLARLWGHRRTDQRIAARQLLDDLMAQIVPRAHQPVALSYPQPASPTRTRPRSTPGRTGSEDHSPRNCAARPKFAAVHGAELGMASFHGCVSIRQVAGSAARARPCWLLQLPSSTRILRVSGADQTTPSTASTRSGWRTFTTGRLQVLVSRANSSAKGSSPRRWRACTLDARRGQRCNHPDSNPAAAPYPPQWPVAETKRQTDHKATRHVRQAACADGWRPWGWPQRLCDQVGSINALSCSEVIRYSGRVWRKGVCKQAHQAKERVERPLLLDQNRLRA